MTREVAIEVIKAYRDKLVNSVSNLLDGDIQALDMAIQALSQEPCDEKRDCSTCKYEEYSSNYQPCRDCGTLLESYTNWEQKERELPCDDVVSRKAVLQAVSEGCQEWRGIYGRCEELINALPSVTHKSGKWIRWREEIQRGTHYTENVPHCKCSECDTEYDTYASRFINFCPNCGARMVEPQESEETE